MKRFYLITLVLLAIISLSCKTTETNTTTGQEKANPESGKILEEESGTKAYVIKKTSFYADGYIKNYQITDYQSDGMPKTQKTYNSYDEITENIEFEKLSDNEIKRNIYEMNNRLQSWRICRKDAKGNLSAEESYAPTGELQTVSLYTHDEKGNVTSWKIADGDQNILSETQYIYENGFNTQINIYDMNGNLVEYFILDYKDGLLHSKSHYLSEQLESVIEYNHEYPNMLKESYFLANGTAVRFVENLYDNQKNLIKAEYYDEEGNLKGWDEFEYQDFNTNIQE